MSLVALLPLVIAGMTLAAGGYHLFIGLRLRGRREHLSFAVLCVAIAVYDLLCARLYAATSPEDGAVWQRWQTLALALGAVALVEFVADYTGGIHRKVRWVIAAAFLPVMAVGLVAPTPWLLTGVPAVRTVAIPLIGVQVTYQEVGTGPLFDVLSLLGLGLFAVVARAAVAMHRGGGRERARPLMVALCLFFLGVVNDAGVGAGLLHSVYVIEYSFLAMVALMAYTLSSTVLRGAAVERELRESQARFRSLVETTSDLVWEVDADGVYTYVSPRVRDVLGWEPGEVVGRTPFELMPPEEAARVSAVFEEVAAEARPFALLENVNLHRDGRRVVLESSGLPVLDAEGRLLGYRGIDRDITAHQDAYVALRESEQRFRALTDNLPGVVYLCRDDADWTMLYLNDAVERLTGHRKEDFLARRIAYANLCHPEDVPGMVAEIAAASEEGRPFRLRYRLARRDGVERHIEEVGVAIRGPGGEPLLEGYIQDVTEREQLEEQLRHAQKMEAVGRLAGGVAHDFNNLLQAIHSHADAIRSALDDPERMAEGLSDLIEQARRGARLTRQLLVFSRRDSPRFEVVDLARVAGDACRLVRRLLREDFELVLEESGGPLWVEGDRGQLEQVVMNLTLNAADAMPRGGRVTVRLTEGHGMARMAVVDTGSGIPDHLRERIFEPFFTTKGPGQGSGLGLSVVHGIVAGHGGSVRLAESGPQGSTFEVSLPTAASEQGTDSKGSGEMEPVGADGDAGKVLLVEDDPGTRSALVGLLESIGWSVAEAESVEEAHRLSQSSDFDVLLSDFLLPDGRGHQLAESLRGRWPRLAVILMTGYADSPEIDDIVTTAKVGFLRKPFGLAALVAEIERVRLRARGEGL